MIENYDYYRNSYNVTEDALHLPDSDAVMHSGDTLTYFVSGNPDITKNVQFIGVDRNDSALFLDAGDKKTVIVIDDTENLFPKA